MDFRSKGVILGFWLYTTLTIALRTGPKAPQHGLKRRNRPKPTRHPNASRMDIELPHCAPVRLTSCKVNRAMRAKRTGAWTQRSTLSAVHLYIPSLLRTLDVANHAFKFINHC
jgi:hypothetical protein